MPTAAIAKTSTPDAVAGNPVDVVTLNPGAGTADRQVVALGDPTTGTNYATVSAAGALKVDASGVAVPVTGPLTDTQLRASVVPVGDGAGSLTVDAPVGTPVFARLSDGAATLIGQKAMAASLPVVVASDQSALPITDAAGTLTVDAPVGTPVFVRLSDGAAALVGQKAMAASLPVVVASDQSAVPVSGTVAVSTIAGAITPGTAAANLGKAEDAGHVSSDTGVLALAVRVDVPNLPTAANTNANTDYSAPSVDDHGVVWVRTRQLVSYTASFRLADATAGQLDLTFTFVANTNKQVATIYHAATATKTVKIRKVSVFCTTMTAAVVGFELRALSAATAPATGNPAITPRQHDPADAAAEATCLALPTTAGSLVGADTGTVSPHTSINAGATTASVSPSSYGTAEIVLYEYKDGSEMKPLTMRAANAEGYAVNARSTAATAQRFTVSMLFTEE